MNIGMVGRKCGMSRVFDEDGVSIPVTVVELLDNRVTAIKTKDSDGYQAVQITTGNKRASLVGKAQAGHYKKAEQEPGRGLWEFRAEGVDELPAIGDAIGADAFEVGQMVDVTGTSKGKGFAGVVKRHNFRTQDATHGNSLSHRAPGSIGQCQTPGRVFKGKKMAGQMGNVRRTVQNLQIVRADREKNLLLIRGAVPGAPGSDVIIRPAVKAKG
jgi:large subunit ribosomal protein L3